MKILKQLLLCVGLKLLEIVALFGGVCIFIFLIMALELFVGWLGAFTFFKIVGYVSGGLIVGLLIVLWFGSNWKWSGELIEGVSQDDIWD